MILGGKRSNENRDSTLESQFWGFRPLFFFLGGGVGGGVVTTVYDLLDFLGRKGGGGVG